MVLNETSYVHKTIRKLCSQLEVMTETKMMTDLGSEFKDIRFVDKYGYIIVDYKKEVIKTLSIKLDPVEFKIVEDIIDYCNWLEIGEKYSKKLCNKNVTFIFKKTIYKPKRNIYTFNREEDKKSSKKTISKELHKM